MVRIAMLSFGHVHAEGYARQVKEHPEAELILVWDDEPERGRPAAERHGVPYVEELEAALGRDDVDAVVLNAPTVQHHELILKAVAAGKHVFTEKALTITTRDADEVVAAVNRSGIKFMISLPQRTRPETLFIKQALDEGWLGDITFFRARIAHSAALDGWFSGGSLWFADEQVAGGGALFDLGCHTVDVVRWLMGQPKSVIARVQNFSGRYPIDDNTVFVVEFENKALGVLDTSWVHRAGPNLWELYGTEGSLLRGLPGQNLALFSRRLQADGVQGWISPTQLPAAQPSPMEQWIAAILRDEPMQITVEDGRNLTELLEATYLAARDGREVTFPLSG